MGRGSGREDFSVYAHPNSHEPTLPVLLARGCTQLAQLENVKAELAWLNAEEETRRLEKKLEGEKESQRKLRLFCQSKTQEEIAFREDSVSR